MAHIDRTRSYDADLESKPVLWYWGPVTQAEFLQWALGYLDAQFSEPAKGPYADRWVYVRVAQHDIRVTLEWAAEGQMRSFLYVGTTADRVLLEKLWLALESNPDLPAGTAIEPLSSRADVGVGLRAIKLYWDRTAPDDGPDPTTAMACVQWWKTALAGSDLDLV